MAAPDTLLALSPLDGRYAHITQPLSRILSEYGLIRCRTTVEIHWLQMLCQHPKIATTPLDESEQQTLHTILDTFSLDEASKVKKIEKTTNHDVKAVEYFLQDHFSNHPTLSQRVPLIHFAATSEDINNLAYALMIKEARQVLDQQIRTIIDHLSNMARQYADLAMLSRTHGQAASPTTVGKELANVVVRLKREHHRFMSCDILGKFNGAVGNYNAHLSAYPDIDWIELTEALVTSLGLTHNPMTTQIEPHDALAELLDHLARLNVILIDLNKDIWGYISLDYFSLRRETSEVGSSTMPHKVNPIDFENSEGNLGMANAIATHLARQLPISRWQRDLTDSTSLRNLGSVFGYCLIAYTACLKGLKKITPNTTALNHDLNRHWEILGEAVQTVLRRYGVSDAYERLKSLTRGKTLTRETLHAWLEDQPIPHDAKQALSNLTPQDYIGLAPTLAVKYLDD
ncbi:MAG: adenylosuccinate lyase [Coxiellaceae bacterium]|mgnify:CR=1 FL=1|nr:adenylosuccinate lyase [Coxiellaceae bacterium]|tara:strand:+ start:999 stop:2372 length:1374 start_codon:yes stop_codon:yes gene_type:complete